VIEDAQAGGLSRRASRLVYPLLFSSFAACAGLTQHYEQAPEGLSESNKPRIEQKLNPSPGPSVSEIKEADGLWKRSLASKSLGDEVNEQRLLGRIVRSLSSSPQAVQARIRLAEEALKRSDWSSAQALVEPLSAEGEEGYARQRVEALAYEGQAKYIEAGEAWLKASEQTQRPDLVKDALGGAAQNQYLGGSLEKARLTAASIGTTSDELREEVEGRFNHPTLVHISEHIAPEDPDRAWLSLALAREYCLRAELELCRKHAQVAYESSQSRIVQGARLLLDRVDAWNDVRPGRLGVLLPLSGPFQEHGQAALESIQQALRGVKHVELVVRDTAASAGKSGVGAEELILDEHVVAILGPIGEKEGRAAVESAARFAVPHLVLSSHPAVSKGVESALRMRLSAGEKVKSLARYAITHLDLKRAAILVPQQASRKRQMIAFWDEFVRLGGEVRAAELYPSDQKDFKEVMSALLGSEKPEVGLVDFDALFIPEDVRQVRRLVPFLKYFGLRTKTHPKLKTTKRTRAVQLLGVEAWNSPTVIDPEGITDNSVFVDTFFHDPEDEDIHSFVRDFYARHRRKPTAFQAEVFDSVKLIVEAMRGLKGGGHEVRAELLEKLFSTRHHRGVTGHMTVLDSGELLIEPRILTVDADEIRLRLSEDEEAYIRGQLRGRN